MSVNALNINIWRSAAVAFKTFDFYLSAKTKNKEDGEMNVLQMERTDERRQKWRLF